MKTSKYMAIVPTPNGPDFRREVYGNNINEISKAGRKALLDEGFRNKKIIPVFRLDTACVVGDMQYVGEYLGRGKFYKKAGVTL